MCCLNPTRAGIIEFVLRGCDEFKKNVDVQLVRRVVASLFPWVVNNRGLVGHFHQFRPTACTHETIIVVLKPDAFANCRGYF